MQSNRKHILIVIPAYNEEARIGKTLAQYAQYFGVKYPNSYELLVVLNGCVDDTESVVKDYQTHHKSIKYMVFTDPIGKGGAVAHGLKVAQADYIGFTDADGSTSPSEMDKLFDVLKNGSDLGSVVGSRSMGDSKVEGKSKTRSIMSKGFNIGVNTLFRLGIKDTQCGAKVFKKEVLDKVVDRLKIANMAFDVNILVEVKKAGYRTKEQAIHWVDTEGSKIGHPIKTSIVMAISVLKLWFFKSPLRYLYPILRPVGFAFQSVVMSPQELQFRYISLDNQPK
jgi:glycosyltransferase involved in cell wall biosynthesis